MVLADNKGVRSTHWTILIYQQLKLFDGNPETGKLYDGSLHSGIIFDNLTEGAEIKIFNLAGEFVCELKGTGKIPWDAKNESGKEVASGVYIYLVTDKTGNWKVCNYQVRCSPTSLIRNGKFGLVKLRSGAGIRLCFMLGGICLW